MSTDQARRATRRHDADAPREPPGDRGHHRGPCASVLSAPGTRRARDRLPPRRHVVGRRTSHGSPSGSPGRTGSSRPDLLGHGDSPREPPWRIDDHLASLGALGRRSGAADLARPLVRRRVSPSSTPRRTPRRSTASCCSTPRSCLPGHVALWAAENGTRGAALRHLRGGDRPPLRGEPAAPGAARARRGGAPRPPRGGHRRMALPLHAGGGRHGVRGDGGGAATVHGSVRIPTLLVLGPGLVPPVRPAARRAPRRARRPARGRHRPRWAHGAVGRARRDGERDRRASSRVQRIAPVSPRSARPRARARRRGSRRPPRPPRA